MRNFLYGLLAIVMATASHAQMAKSEKAASNGVEISVNSDDFAGRYEYTAPTIRFKDGFALIAIIKEGEEVRGPYIMGNMMYSDQSWRRYDQAILRGGEKVDAVFADRDVISCRGSRYSGCTYSEGFQITLSADQLRRLSEVGTLDIQLKGVPGSEVILTVPASYFAAVKEVAGS